MVDIIEVFADEYTTITKHGDNENLTLVFCIHKSITRTHGVVFWGFTVLMAIAVHKLYKLI